MLPAKTFLHRILSGPTAFVVQTVRLFAATLLFVGLGMGPPWSENAVAEDEASASTLQEVNSEMLATVLKAKVLVTLISWSLPLLFCSPSWFVRMGMPEPKPVMFLRLLGAAYLALVVGYISGIRKLGRGDDVRNIVWVGITSNGLSSLILLRSGTAGAWKGWGPVARIYMWGSALVTAAITLGLVVAGLFRDDR